MESLSRAKFDDQDIGQNKKALGFQIPKPKSSELKTAKFKFILGGALLILFALISHRGLNEPDEGRYVEIAREMMVSGDYVVPRIKGVPHYAKPPLTYWCLALSMKVFGVHEVGARMPSFLAALLVLFVLKDFLIHFGCQEESSWLMVFVLLSTLEFFALLQIVTTDMILCATIVLAMYARWRSLKAQQGRRFWNLLFWISLGLGFLVKGPIILMVVFVPLIFQGVIGRSPLPLRNLGWLWGIPLFCVIVLPWFLMVTQQQEGLTDFFLGEEVVDRVRHGRGRSKPVYYFLLVFPLVLLPWTGIIIGAIRKLLTEPHDAKLFLLGWLLGPFIVFSLASSKLWTYMLPLVPPAILVLGIAVDSFSAKKKLHLALGCGVAFLMFSILVLVAENRSLELRNNAGYQGFLSTLPDESYRGQSIEDGGGTRVGPPVFAAGSGPKIATYRFRMMAASFYIMREKAAFVPSYGNGSLWEWEDMQRLDRPGELPDLVAELRLPEDFVVLTKQRYREELEEALGRPLKLLAKSGTGRATVVALSNQ